MKITVCSDLLKIINEKDCLEITQGNCLKNESYNFQMYLQAEEDFVGDITVFSKLNVHIYEVIRKKGHYDAHEKFDDYYLKTEDDTYPELLLPIDKIEMKKGQSATLFVEISAEDKPCGEHEILIRIGAHKKRFVLSVLDKTLEETDLTITNWLHLDGICVYYNVEPFSEAFYEKFKWFLEAYVKMGNNMLLIPLFTPPLDTQVGGERLTTQLVGVEKSGETYAFDFTELKKYIDLAKEYGIRYFELSHLFTQWGGQCCPKIMVREKGELYNAFGWDCPSLSDKYLNFLKQFLPKLMEFLTENGIKENSFLHLTDEPISKDVETYTALFHFVKKYCSGIRTMDALSHYEFAQKGLVDMPAVCIQSEDLEKFGEMPKLLYYCVGTDKDFITNRYFDMPLLRTIVLGEHLYLENAAGFLHWGFNFYNAQFSVRPVNPYEDATAGGGFIAGDSFIVYPAERGVHYSIRFFAMVKAFEDYRLLKALEKKIGREGVLTFLRQEGVKTIHEYPHSEAWYIAFKDKLRAMV